MTSKRSARHNVYRPPTWSALENSLLEENQSKTPCEMVRIFAQHGLSRTNRAITHQRYRLGLKKDVESTPPIDYREMDKTFCMAMRAAHPDKETGPIRWRHRDGIPTIIPRAIGPMGSGWQIDGGSGL